MANKELRSRLARFTAPAAVLLSEWDNPVPPDSEVYFATEQGIQIGDDTTADQREAIMSLIKEFDDVFCDHPGTTHLIEAEIDTGDARPINTRPYRLSDPKQTGLKAQVEDWLAKDIIEPSKSPWTCPIVMATKPDGTYRV